MKTLQAIRNSYTESCIKLFAFFSLMFASVQAMALDPINLTENSGNNRNFSDIAGNIDNAAQVGAALIIQLVTIGGFIVVALSLYQLYKASKDEREKPTSAVVGLVIGGAMAGVGTIMWMMKNTITG